MTAASEEVLSEVNGGHTITLRRDLLYRSSGCGGGYYSYSKWYVSTSKANGCTGKCPGKAALLMVENGYARTSGSKLEFQIIPSTYPNVWGVLWGNGCSAQVGYNSTEGYYGIMGVPYVR